MARGGQARDRFLHYGRELVHPGSDGESARQRRRPPIGHGVAYAGRSQREAARGWECVAVGGAARP